MKTISIFNQKGGVGKTTSVVNLAVALAYLNKKVLVIDVDPQANSTTGLGLEESDKSLYDLFYASADNETKDIDHDSETTEESEMEEISENSESEVDDSTGQKENTNQEESSNQEENSDKVENNEDHEDFNELDIKAFINPTKAGVDLIASESSLSGLEVELVALDPYKRTQQLKNIVDKIDEDSYDFILIDCPPSLGLLSINALVASDSVIVPIQTEYYALEGVSELINTVNLVKQQLNPNLEIEGVLLTMFDKRTILSYEVVEEVKSYFKTQVFKVMIPRNPRLAEAPSHGLSTIEYDPKSQGAVAYISLANEIIENNEEDEDVK